MFVNSSDCTKGGSQVGGSPPPWLVPAVSKAVGQRALVYYDVATSDHGNCVTSTDASGSAATNRKALNGSEQKEDKFYSHMVKKDSI